MGVNDFLSTVNMKEYWSYDGSFTTPPCTEGIKWTVIKQVQSISKDQLEKITDRLAGEKDFAEGKGNNRVVQLVEDRIIYYTGEVQEDAATNLFASLTAFAAIAALAF